MNRGVSKHPLKGWSMKIFLIGFMGSGKTHWGKLLSEKLGMRFFDLDDQVAENSEKTIVEIFEKEGEEKFRLMEKDILHIITESQDSFIMACGGGTPCYFNNIEYLKLSGTTVWINTPLEVLFSRLKKQKAQRPLIKELSDDQLWATIIRKFSDRKIYYEQATITIDEDPVLLENLIEKIFHA